MEDNYQKSLKIINRLVRKSVYNNANTIAMYENYDDEVNTTFILKHHILSEDKELIIIEDSIDNIQADLFIIPCSSFDENGNIITRINIKNNKKIFALCFEENKVDNVISQSKAKVLSDKAGYNV